MEHYVVTGMSCAACQNRVEQAVSKLDGVDSCSVSLLTNSMQVEGSASSQAVIEAVRKAGYGARLMGDETSGSMASSSLKQQEDALKDRTTPKLVRRLVASAVFLVVLMYLSMGHNMWGWPVPAFLENAAANTLTQMLLAIIIMYINRDFFTSGYRSLFSGAPNMDTLVALGSTASFGYSLVVFYLMLAALGRGDQGAAEAYRHQLYFESAAMIPTLITIGKTLESLSKGRTTDALKSLMALSPKTADKVVGDHLETVPVEQIAIGDRFAVKPGASIPVDGVIVEGDTAVNEAALTGESIPVDKTVGDVVSAATINQNGYIVARATRVGEDTTLSQIIRMVSDAAGSKAPIARIADKVAAVFVPVVIGISLFTLAVWLIAGRPFSFAIARAIAVLVISCPCALGLATPVAIMVGSGVGSKNGILFKTATALEQAGKIQIVALDKTGTITTGVPQVTDVYAVDGDQASLVALAAQLESRSEHPLAKAVTAYAGSQQLAVDDSAVSEFQSLTGSGVTSVIAGRRITGGSAKFMASRHPLSADLQQRIAGFSAQGKTPMLFADEEHILGIIAVADQIKADSAQAIAQLKRQGIRVAMITGDNPRTAQAIAQSAGITEVTAEVLPDQKESVIAGLKHQGMTAMVGDGINDAPALTGADLGIAIGAGTDVAIDAADVVLMKSDLKDVPAAVRLARGVIRNIHENLFWAFFYNVLCIPLAAGFYQALFGLDWQMSPMLGAACMSLSSVTVCLNALRLNLFKVYDDRGDRPYRRHKGKTKEEDNMTKETLHVEGMMCEMCEKHVREALEAVEGVASASADHNAKQAEVRLTKPVSDEALKTAVEQAGYHVTGIDRA
jgi:Cu2+-exporting ATPase